MTNGRIEQKATPQVKFKFEISLQISYFSVLIYFDKLW